jgi:hypothetical protein
VFHIAKKSEGENDPSVMCTILCALGVMQNLTNECKILKQ